MKILVTGISGFVGPHLQHELESHGHEVFGIDRQGDGKTIFSVDLLDSDKVNNFFTSHTFDWIIHLAAITSVGESWKDPKKFFDINVNMTKNIYNGLDASGATTSVLITSSSDVYGKQEKLPIKEDAIPHPGNPYAESKLAQEKTALSYNSRKTIISRAFNHAGPGGSAFLAIPSFARQIALCEATKQDTVSVGNLESYRDYTDVRDVVRAYRLLVEKGNQGETYNICSGEKIQMQGVINRLIALAKVEIQVVQNPDLMRPSDVPEFYGSFEKIQHALGWAPQIPFTQTLEDTLNYWRNKVT